jgi:hypothetical protein
LLRDVDVFANSHPVHQEAEVGLVHAEHVLHSLGGDADLLPITRSPSAFLNSRNPSDIA